MKQVYLDTNVILTLLRSQEENYSIVQLLSNLKNITFFTGTMTIIEITSVLSREEKVFKEALLNLSNDLDIRELISLSFEEQIIIIIEFLFKAFNITILDEPAHENLQINKKKIILPAVYVLGIKLTERIKLRTLDLIHLMTIEYYKQIKDLKFDYFITSDSVILGKRIEIQRGLETIVTDPEGILKIET
jgi:predicted nucleic acid-binding protein